MPHLLGVERALRRAFIRAQNARSVARSSSVRRAPAPPFVSFPTRNQKALPINTQ
jgi:hypothetical protein